MAIIQKSFGDLITFTRGSEATYIDATGNIRTAGINEPRFTYDPVTGESVGLLIEGQATNLMVPSDYPKETTSGLSISGDSIYIGDITLVPFTEDSSNGSHFVNSTIVSRVSGTTYTESFYAKSSGRQVYVFSSSSVWGGNTSARFNLDDGTVEATTNATAKMEYIGGGVWRCQLTATAFESGSTSWRYYLHNGSSFSYQGDALSGVYMGGIQSEVGSIPTSYIPTEVSQVTRAADTSSVSTDSFPLNPLEGTFFIDMIGSPPTNAFADSVFGLSDSPSSYLLTIELSARPRLRSVISGYDNLPLPADYTGGPAKIAISFGQDKIIFAVNGIVRETSNLIAKQAYEQAMYITLDRAGSEDRREYGTYKSVTYYPRALSDAELQEMTS